MGTVSHRSERHRLDFQFHLPEGQGGKLDLLMEALCAIDGLDPVISHSGLTGVAEVSIEVDAFQFDADA